MRVDIVVPQIGEAIAELHIVTWYKTAGDRISKGDVLFDVDSDKAIVEVEAYMDGELVEIVCGEGSAVMPQQTVAVLETESAGASVPPGDAMAPASDPKAAHRPVQQGASPVAERVAADLGVDLALVDGSGPRGRVVVDDVRRHAKGTAGNGMVNASPKARVHARRNGVDLSTLSGSGVDSMIIVRDVEAAAASVGSAAGWRPLSKRRATIAEHTTSAKQTTPHFYLEVDVNMTQVDNLRASCVERLGWERPPTYTDALTRACALALTDLSWANVSYENGGLRERPQVAIGVAVGVDEGLLTPTLPAGELKSLWQTSSALRGVIARARSGRLKPTDMDEKSMVVSNLGMFSVDRFAAIIDAPDPMILAVGRVADRVVALNGQAVVQPMCTLTLSIDHRVFDGVQGARILERIKDILENPFDMLGQSHD